MSSAAVPGVSQDDFLVFTMAVNRFDLLDETVASAAPYNLVIIDNSDGKLGDRYKNTSHVSIFTPPVPLSFTQSSNIEYRMAAAFGKKYYIHMHSDVTFPSARIGDLLTKAREADAEGRRYLVIFTLYDLLCLYRVDAMVELGGYDSHMFSFYSSDLDIWYRAKLAGYERIEAGGEGIVHLSGGSGTINGDSRWNICNAHIHSGETFRQKWGGDPGHEVYDAPFGRPDVFTDMKPVVP